MRFTILFALMSLFIVACDATEEDSYLTTELNGLYKYKSAYMTDGCTGDLKYDIDLRDTLEQPYFKLEGKRGVTDNEHQVLVYICEDSKFKTCTIEDEYGYPIENVFAQGSDGNWVLNHKLTASYDKKAKACLYERDKVISFELQKAMIEGEFGIEDLLTIDIDYMAYYDTESSVEDCKSKNVDYGELKCITKKRYLTQRKVINEIDQEVFNKKSEEVEEEK